ncbi:MAG: dTDP-4-dehydrorhamnose reductase [Promethearchaeota archaeon]
MINNIRKDDFEIKILVIGANGFLGSNFFSKTNNEYFLNKRINIIASGLHASILNNDIKFYKIDITNKRETINKISNLEPDIIILTAALTNVDQCELNKKLALKVNVDGPKNVLEACQRINAKLIFFSTDFVFDGKKEGGSYTEDDHPNPINYYGLTKYKAELAIMNSNIEYLICRTSVLYGWNSRKQNFITWILNNLRQNKEIKIVTDQINSPTYVENLTKIIIKLIEKKIQGIYHTAGDCALSRYDMAIKCAQIFSYDLSLIKPIKNLKQIAIRPKNSSLNVSKLKNLNLGVNIFSFEEGLIDMYNKDFSYKNSDVCN